jgi:hypothetical protein
MFRKIGNFFTRIFSVFTAKPKAGKTQTCLNDSKSDDADNWRAYDYSCMSEVKPIYQREAYVNWASD